MSLKAVLKKEKKNYHYFKKLIIIAHVDQDECSFQNIMLNVKCIPNLSKSWIRKTF